MVLLAATSSARGQEPAASTSPAATHAAEARRFGWKAAAPLMDNLAQSDPNKFPGLQAFAKDYRKAGQGLDPDQPLERWPALDIEALVTRNPNFWRANYEVRPGDPAWLYLHAGLLLSAGEATRAQQVLALAKQSPGTPKAIRDAIDQMLTVAERVIRDANEAVAAGIEVYDKGAKAAALKRYRDALVVWPQNSFAHYELALTLRAQELEARGERVPKSGASVTAKVPKLPEVDEHFALARRHDPLRWEAYQGPAREMGPRLIALQGGLKAWQAIATARGKLVPDEVLVDFAEGCQGAGIHDLALVARQVAVWRERQLGRDDLNFITRSLRALAPGPQAEAALKFLDNPRIEMRSLTDPEPDEPRK